MKKSEVEKGLGVFISHDLKPSKHVAVVAAKANKIVGLMKKNVDFLDAETILSIYREVALNRTWTNTERNDLLYSKCV